MNKKMNIKLKQYILVTLGTACVALSYYFLFKPANVVSGGVTGISLIIAHFVKWEYIDSIIQYALNGLLLVVGLIFLGKDFFIKTVYGSLLLPSIIMLLELLHVPSDFLFTIDQNYFGAAEPMLPLAKTLIAIVVGGSIAGFGLGICYKNNGSTGGFDVLQVLISKYLHLPYSACVYTTDGIIAAVSMTAFGFQQAIFSFLMILLVGNVADFVEMGGKIRRTVFIISKKYEEIMKFIIDDLDRGVTIDHVYGGYSHEDFPMLICTLSKRESYVLRDYLLRTDPAAFTFYVSAREVYGDGFE